MHLFGSEGEFFFFFSFSRERDALDPALPTEAPRGPCSAEESDRLKQSLCKKYKNTTKKLESCRFVPTSLSPQEVQKEEKRVRVICNRVQVKIYKRSSVPGISRLWPLKEKGKMKTTW